MLLRVSLGPYYLPYEHFFSFYIQQILNPPPPRPRASFASNSFHNPDHDGVDDSNPVVCNCGIPARLLTVKKDGPNHGNFAFVLTILIPKMFCSGE